jgi:F-type H+-transporting ATPase subunit epsilon
MNNSSFMLEVLTPDKTLYWGRAIGLKVKAVDGELQILPGHVPYVNVLVEGEVIMFAEDKTNLHFKHTGGIIEVAKEKTSVLVFQQIEKEKV